jgi:sec-independent protein translocase protein TatC
MKRPSELLQKGRPYVIIGTFVVTALVTEPTVVAQLSLALPVIVLYEVSIWCAKLAGR